MITYPTNYAADILGIKTRLATKKELNMREIIHPLLIIFTVFLTVACTSQSKPPKPPKPPESQVLDQVLADHNYRIGEEVHSISDIRLADRIYVDPKNLFIPVEGGEYDLVALKEVCYGLKTRDIALRNGTYRALKKWDRFVTLYRGRSADTCWVDAIYQLEKKH
jgi:hypothetical protein